MKHLLLLACLALSAPPGYPRSTGSPGSLAPAIAQAAEPLPVAAASGFGLADSEHGLLALGPGYKAYLGSGEVALHPALGREAPGPTPLVLRFDELVRGDARLARGGPSVSRAVGNVAIYDRGEGIEERWQARADGLELSFRVPARPAGAGDLVARLVVDTALTPNVGAAGGLRFELAGYGGIDVGAVTGVDAAGRTARGTVELLGDTLELRLPARFVDTATYPLTLDPLFGPTVLPGGTAEEPAVAYCALSGRWLLVFEQIFSASDADIYAQRVDDLGIKIGAKLAIDAAVGGLPGFPAVCSVFEADRFLVVWQSTTATFASADILGRSVAALTGSLSATVNVANTTDHESLPDVAGHAAYDAQKNKAIAVWTRGGVGIRGVQITVPATGNPVVNSLFGGLSISSDASDTRASLSKGGGPNNRLLVAWQRSISGIFGTSNGILARLYSLDAVALTGEVLVADLPGLDERDPDVDGDGTDWLVVYEQEETATGPDDVVAKRVHYNGATLAPDGLSTDIAADAGQGETDPSVGYVGGAYVVAWLDPPGAANNLRVATFLADCSACEPVDSLAVFPASPTRNPAVATQYDGFASTLGNNAMIASQVDAASDLVLAQYWKVVKGTALDLGGGCGAGGTATITCAVVGNLAFEHRLSGAGPGRMGWLALGFEPGGPSCGACSFRVDPFGAWILSAGVTSGAGSLKLATPIPAIPSLAGAGFFDQWVTAAPAGACSLGFELSNALSVTIE